MKSVFFLLCVSVLNLAWGRDAPAATNPPDRPVSGSSAADLVKQLGNESFEVRQAAFQRLLGLGRSAEAEVRAGLTFPDAEVRRLCEMLLPLCRRSDLDIRLDAFLTGEEDKQLPALAGWAKFKELAGKDRAARRLFVELYRSDRALLELLEKDPKQVGAQFPVRIQKVTNNFGIMVVAARDGKPTHNLGEVVGVVLTAACSPTTLDVSSFYRLVNLFSQPAIRGQVMGDPAIGRLLTPLLAGHLNNPGMVYQIYYLANNLGLTEFISTTLKPEVRRSVAAARANPTDFNKVQQAVNMCQQFQMTDIIQTELQPAVRKLAESFVESPGDQNRSNLFIQVVNMVRALDMRDTLEMLRPTGKKMLVEASQPPLDLNKINTALCMAQTLQMQDDIGMVLKPAVHRLVMDLTQHPLDINQMYQVIHLVRSVQLQDTMDTVLKPWIRRQIIAMLEESDDVNKISQTVNIVRAAGLNDLVEDLLKPAIGKLLASLLKSPGDTNWVTQAYHLALTLNLRDAIEKSIKPALRQALVAAADQPLQQGTFYQTLVLAQSLQMKEGLPLALKAVMAKDLNVWMRAQAVLYVAKMGEKDQGDQLKPLLEDMTPLGQMGINNQMINTQMRDLALAAMLSMKGQALKDYGFPYFQMIPGADLASSGAHCAGFGDEASRSAAFKKGKEWLAAHQK